MDLFLVAFGILLILSVIASKITDRVGIPAVLLFLVVGCWQVQMAWKG